MSSIEETLLRLAAECGPGKSFTPEDVARAAGGEEWRRLLPEVRRIAVALAEAGRLEILRKGKPVNPKEFKGVYRLRIGS